VLHGSAICNFTSNHHVYTSPIECKVEFARHVATCHTSHRTVWNITLSTKALETQLIATKIELMEYIIKCRGWGSHSGGYEEFYLLGYNAV
jgi:meiotically up-regulated gene 157 (Mug157) protein